MINTKADLSVENIGISNTPVICIDNFFNNHQALAHYASTKTKFDPAQKSMYPGIRSDLPTTFIQEYMYPLAKLINKVYWLEQSRGLQVSGAYFSIVTQAEEELQAFQRIPHYDNANPKSFALIHYINDGEFGGTGFFRHKPDNFELINLQNCDQYHESVLNYISKHGEPKNTYISESNEQYELIKKIDYKPNRLLLYPAGVLHSGLIRPEYDIDPNPLTGRLTVTMFFNVK